MISFFRKQSVLVLTSRLAQCIVHNKEFGIKRNNVYVTAWLALSALLGCPALHVGVEQQGGELCK